MKKEIAMESKNEYNPISVSSKLPSIGIKKVLPITEIIDDQGNNIID